MFPFCISSSSTVEGSGSFCALCFRGSCRSTNQRTGGTRQARALAKEGFGLGVRRFPATRFARHSSKVHSSQEGPRGDTMRKPCSMWTPPPPPPPASQVTYGGGTRPDDHICVLVARTYRSGKKRKRMPLASPQARCRVGGPANGRMLIRPSRFHVENRPGSQKSRSPRTHIDEPGRRRYTMQVTGPEKTVGCPREKAR